MGLMIEKLGFPIGVSLILLGIVWWMIRSLVGERGLLRQAIDQLEGGIASLRGLIACCLMQDGSDVNKAITTVDDMCHIVKKGDSHNEN